MSGIVSILNKVTSMRRRSATHQFSDLLEKFPPALGRELDVELGMLLIG
jgi:hypothetical protein